jgi:hypothetical protein
MPDTPVCLSIRQPWAWLIVHGHKTIENRSWRAWKRGRILIHTGKGIDGEAVEDLRAGLHPVTGRPCAFDLPAAFDLGGIVGEATIVDCVTGSDDEWFVGPYGIVLADARPLPFAACRGALGFFKLPEVTR